MTDDKTRAPGLTGVAALEAEMRDRLKAKELIIEAQAKRIEELEEALGEIVCGRVMIIARE